MLDDLDLRLDARATVLIGPNGAGKSTVLRLFARQLRPTAGRITGAARIGFGSQHAVALPGFRVDEQIQYAAWLAGIPRDKATTAAGRALELADLANLAERQATQLSGGQTARLGIACALAGYPDYLLLDEPTASLDPLSRRSVTAVLRGLSARGVGVVASSHTATDVATPFQRLLVLDEGRLVFDDTVEAFRRGTHTQPLVADLAEALRDR